MLKTGTAEKNAPAKGIFRDTDGTAPSERLFRQEEPTAGATERYHVSAENDPEEISAERTADRVMGGGSLFREADGPGAEGGEAEVPSADLAGPGSALPTGLQESMGASIGADFSGVRVHTGAGADRASRSLSARAFARGQDLYFRDGEYDPGSQEGQHLIAHELAHVADGAGGLHRAPPAGNAPATSAPLPAVNRPLPEKAGEVDMDMVKQAVDDFTKKAGEAEIVANAAGKQALEEIGTRKTELERARDNLQAAADYQQALDTYLKDENIGNIDGETRNKLESAKTKLENLKIAEKQKKVGDLLATATSEESIGKNAPMSGAVKDMLNSPYFPQFLKAVDQLRAADGFGDAEEVAAKGVKGKKSEMSAEDKRKYIGHRNDDTKIIKAKDSSTWMGTTGTVLSAVGEATDEVGEAAGEVRSEVVKQEGKEKEEAEEEGENVSGAMSAAGEGLGAIGAGFSMAQNSKDAEVQRKQDAKAKQAMKGIAKQLKRTLPLQMQDSSAGSAAQGNQKRIGRIQAVCSRIEQTKFSDEKVSLELLIEDAMDENPDLKPTLNEKQKGLLSTLLTLETSRASSKEKAKELRQDAIFNAMDMVGSALKSVGGFISSLGGSGLVGSIISLIGSVFGQISGVRDKIVGEEKDGGDENEKKLAASRLAIQQMATLPELEEKDKLTQKAKGEAQEVSGKAVAVAEKYAAVFYTIESANVNMSDILFAIEKGEFGKKTGKNSTKSTADSLKDMYANLSFS